MGAHDMATTVWLLALLVSGALTIPTIVYAIECIAGSLPIKRTGSFQDVVRPAVAVLVPAHDEETGIGATVRSTRAQMLPADRIVVVVDNCMDRTAEFARAAGAEVIERVDPDRRGKGFAINFGLAHLASAPPPVVVFIDADCTLLDGCLDALSRATWETDRPVQACNLMVTRDDQKKAFGIAEFAFLVKNYVRPCGLSQLGLPCQLTGTGMALPWRLASRTRIAGAELAEDMKLGLDLAASGEFPVYCEEAGVRSFFPEDLSSAASQRRRWENGHLGILATGLRRLADPRAWTPRHTAMLLDVMVPPLTLLAFLIAIAASIGAAVAGIGFGWAPLGIAAGLCFLLVGSTICAWIAHGRNILPLKTLSRMPQYALAKVSIYSERLRGRSERNWVRTARVGDAGQQRIPR